MASPDGLEIDLTFVNVFDVLFVPPSILGKTKTSVGDIVELVLGGITAVWSLGILFILSPSLATVSWELTTDIQL